MTLASYNLGVKGRASPRLAEKHSYLGSTDSEARAAEAGEEMMEWTDEE